MFIPILAFLILVAGVFLLTPAKLLASILRAVIPIGMIGIGILLIFARQALFGSITFFAGIAMLRKLREGNANKNSTVNTAENAQEASRLRTAALEVSLNTSQEVISGIVLAGSFENIELHTMKLNDLRKLRDEIHEDSKSCELLDSYLDGRFAGWRENTDPDIRAG